METGTLELMVRTRAQHDNDRGEVAGEPRVKDHCNKQLQEITAETES